MEDVNGIIKITEERSNDIDLIATIKNSFENFYRDDIDHPLIKALCNFSMPDLSLKYYIKERHKDYELTEIDDLYIDEVYKHLEEGIFLVMATVHIENHICTIHSVKDYKYSVYYLEDDEEEILKMHDAWYNRLIYGLHIRGNKDDLEVRYCGDFTGGGLTSLFYWISFLKENDPDPRFNTNKPLVQEVIKAIYNGIIFK